MKFLVNKPVCIMLFGLFAVSACSSSEEAKPMGTVSGQVMFNGKPLKNGVVIFSMASSGFEAVAELTNEGTYAFDGQGIPAGDFKVTVGPPPAPVPPPEEPLPPPDFPKVPSKYRETSKTDLTVKVVTGENSFDFDLK